MKERHRVRGLRDWQLGPRLFLRCDAEGGIARWALSAMVEAYNQNTFVVEQPLSREEARNIIRRGR